MLLSPQQRDSYFPVACISIYWLCTLRLFSALTIPVTHRVSYPLYPRMVYRLNLHSNPVLRLSALSSRIASLHPPQLFSASSRARKAGIRLSLLPVLSALPHSQSSYKTPLKAVLTFPVIKYNQNHVFHFSHQIAFPGTSTPSTHSSVSQPAPHALPHQSPIYSTTHRLYA